uniref:Uncharacterized protein n=1 Tax=Sphaerodactylus townsendi TaxID=933632 RepID=A0ACB8FKB2_9SAUR
MGYCLVRAAMAAGDLGRFSVRCVPAQIIKSLLEQRVMIVTFRQPFVHEHKDLDNPSCRLFSQRRMSLLAGHPRVKHLRIPPPTLLVIMHIISCWTMGGSIPKFLKDSTDSL